MNLVAHPFSHIYFIVRDKPIKYCSRVFVKPHIVDQVLASTFKDHGRESSDSINYANNVLINIKTVIADSFNTIYNFNLVYEFLK